MTDTILRAVDEKGCFRFHFAKTTDVVEELRRLHECSPTATAAMGRAATITAMLGMDLKSEGESITLQIRGDGPGSPVIAVCDRPGTVRCSSGNPSADVASRPDGHLDVGAWIGRDGQLAVIKGYELKDPFVGITELCSGEIAEDVAHYFYYSEQTPTVVMLGVLVERDRSCAASGGLLIQALPDADDADLQKMQEAVDQLPPVSELIQRGENPASILTHFFSAFAPRILDETEVRYECSCSREKMERVLASLPGKDVVEMAEEDGGAEIVCQFCNKKYPFSAEELMALPNVRTNEEMKP